MKIIPAVILLFLALFTPARAADEAKPEKKPAATIAELDVRIAKALADARIPEASIAVIEDRRGDLVLTLAFGAGFTWGGNLIRW